MTPNPLGATVESYFPGRVRVRIPRAHRNQEVVSDISGLLKGIEGIKLVGTNVATGSILVEYDPDALDVEQLIAFGQAANIIGDVTAAAGAEPAALGLPPTSITARRMITSFRRLDSTVNRLSRGLIDAKTLAPLALLTLSLVRALGDERRPAAPWYTLMWYAYSSFMHWNRPSDGGLE